MAHAFISYVSEDAAAARYVAAVLRHNGVEPWLDKADLKPGTSWKAQLREAIQSGDAFIPLFSVAWTSRVRTVANEELLVAIDELRKRPLNRAWFVPVRINECIPPDYDIGPNVQVSDIQRVDIPEHGWPEAMRRLLTTLGVAKPDLAVGEPLGPGLPPRLDITTGEIVVRTCDPPTALLQQMVFFVSGGHCARTEDGKILAYIKSRSPGADLQLVNEQFGLADFYVECADSELSSDSTRPSRFRMERDILFPAGTRGWHPVLGSVILPVDIGCRSAYTVTTTLNGGRASGEFVLNTHLNSGVTVVAAGDYWFDVRAGYGI